MEWTPVEPLCLHFDVLAPAPLMPDLRIPMRLCASVLLFALLAVSSCADRPPKKPEQVSGNSRTNLQETESSSLVGSWAISIADEPEQAA